MKKILIFISIFVLILTFLAGSYSYGMQVRPQMRGNVRDNLFTLRAIRMTQALDLTEKQTAVIFPELSRTEKEKAEIQRELAKELRELRALIKEEKTPEGQYETRVARIVELRRKIREKEEAFEKFLFEQLTPVQKAKYIIFNLDFNANLMMRMRREVQPGQKIK